MIKRKIRTLENNTSPAAAEQPDRIVSRALSTEYLRPFRPKHSLVSSCSALLLLLRVQILTRPRYLLQFIQINAGSSVQEKRNGIFYFAATNLRQHISSGNWIYPAFIYSGNIIGRAYHINNNQSRSLHRTFRIFQISSLKKYRNFGISTTGMPSWRGGHCTVSIYVKYFETAI